MLSGKIFIILACLLAAAATVKFALAQSDLPEINRTLTLKAQAETWTQKVCLGDLVEDGWVQSRCAIDQASCCRWNMGGEHQKTFRREDIGRELSKIKFAGIELALQGADQIAVTQTHRELSAAEIRSKIVALAAAKLGEDVQNLGVISLRIPAPIYVSLNSESAWDVILPEQISEHMNIKVVSTADGGQSMGWTEVVMRQDSDVYVARKTIHPTDIIKPEDFEIRKSNVLAAQSSGQTFYRKGQFPDGQRARMTIMAGSALLADQIERVPSVRLGDTVTLILRSDNLRISTKGVVQSSAAIGDMVTVTLQRYNRTFRGRLMDGKLVEVWL